MAPEAFDLPSIANDRNRPIAVITDFVKVQLVNWLKNYRQFLKDGSSERVVRRASWVMWVFTALWAIGLVALLKSPLPGGAGTSTIVLYAGLLVAAYVLYCIVKLLFLPSQR
jgi:hypothetical protein